MAEYQTTPGDTTIVRERSSTGRTLAIVAVVAIAIVAILFATGFWSADVKDTGSLPEVSVQGGSLPKVDVDSKKVVVGTTKTTIDVPKVETTKKTIDVPVVGVTDGDNK